MAEPLCQDDHGIRLYRSDCGDQMILIFRHGKGGAVVAFALVPLRESGKDHGDLCVCSSSHGGLFQRRINGILIGAVALCIGYTGSVLQRTADLRTVDMAAAAALIPGVLRKFAKDTALQPFARGSTPFSFFSRTAEFSATETAIR